MTSGPTDRQAKPSPEATAVFERIVGHPGLTTDVRLMLMRRSENVFFANAHELLEWIEALSDKSVVGSILMDADASHQVNEAYLTELHRLWHNYAAAALTLAEHIDRFAGYEESGDFKERYEARKNAMVGVPVVRFTKRLRNHMLHRGFPFSTVRLRFELGGKVSGSIAVDCRQLLEDGDWTGEAKRYIDNKQPELRLEQSVTEYLDAMDGYYTDFFEAYRAPHQEDFTSLQELMDEYDALAPAQGIRFSDGSAHRQVQPPPAARARRSGTAGRKSRRR